MNKFLKWVLAGVVVLGILFVVAAVVLPKVVDPNNYKNEIRATVLEKTGRELTIGGQIKWTVFPSIGFDLSNLELGNRGGFGDQPMLNIGAAGASVKLIPLFSGRLEIGKINLSDVSAHLHRKRNGQNNWEDLGGQQTASATASGPADDGLDSVMVSGIEISNADVTLDDAGEITELKGFFLTASNIQLGRPFKLEGGFLVNLAQSHTSGEVNFSGLVQSEANGTGYGIDGLSISFEGEKGLPGESMPLDLVINANADVDLNKDQATLSDFVLRFHDLLVKGALDVTSLSHQPTFEGRLGLEKFSPKSLMRSLGLEVPETADKNALTSLSAEMNFSGSGDSANMQELVVKLDKSSFNGNLKVENFDQPGVDFDFEIDQINLDEYLPEVATVTGAANDESAGESDLTVDMFRGFTGGGDFRIGELVVSGMKATDVSLKMTSKGKGFRLFPVSARFYGGMHKGDVRVDASGKQPVLIANHELTGVQAEGLLQDLTGSAHLQGKGDVSLNIRTDITNSRTFRQALSGDLGMKFIDGAIVGFNIAESIRNAKDLLGKQQETDADNSRDPKTDFSELSMSGRIEQGIMKSDDLMMKSPLLRVTGKGRFNLVEETINYLLEPVLVGNLEGQGGQGLDELNGIPVPVRLTGNLYEPDYAIDILAAIGGSQKELIDNTKNELINQLLGAEDDPDSVAQDGEAGQKEDSVQSLLDGVFASDKEKKKKKKKKNKNKDKESDGGTQ